VGQDHIEVLSRALHERACAVNEALRGIKQSGSSFTMIAKHFGAIREPFGEDKVIKQERKVLKELVKLDKMYKKQNIKALQKLMRFEKEQTHRLGNPFYQKNTKG